MKIALFHDYLTQQGGAENVFKVLTEIFPNAPIYTFFYDYKKFESMLNDREIHASFLQKIPGIKRHYRWTLPFMPQIVEKFNFDDYDVVISSTSAFGKGIKTGAKTKHICYCHTPTRYLWMDSKDYVEQLKYSSPVKKIIPILLSNLRKWDKIASQRVDTYIGNSIEVQARIKKFYEKDSVLIYPSVNVQDFKVNKNVEIDPAKGYYLIGGRLVAYKRYDIAITAFSRMGIKLKVFGDGPELRTLQKMARKNIEFVGRVNEDEKKELLANCIAFIHPQVEDFGITPIETMASGRPVIAYPVGGAGESVVDGKTGTFFPEQTWESLTETVIRFQPESFDSDVIREHAQKFDVENFKREILSVVNG